MKHLRAFGLLAFVASIPFVVSAAPVAKIPAGEVVDLSYAYDNDTIYWPTADGFELEVDFKGLTDNGFYYEANTLRTAEHGGTHLDAPVHFAIGAHHTDEIPLDRLIGPAVLLDITAKTLSDRDYQLSVADLEAWEAKHGRLPDGVILLIRTGFGRYWPNPVTYLGTDLRGAEAVPLLHFPGIHPEAAHWLAEKRDIRAVGLDTASIDRGQSTGFETHRILFARNIPAFENVANLDQLPETGFHIIALPMKIKGGSGGPLRIIAIVPP